ncbi:unnamed protein product [Closterium sp. Yama58-4]|nr:unnamed protein product [Closterium sp. Yama58-4]
MHLLSPAAPALTGSEAGARGDLGEDELHVGLGGGHQQHQLALLPRPLSALAHMRRSFATRCSPPPLGLPPLGPPPLGPPPLGLPPLGLPPLGPPPLGPPPLGPPPLGLPPLGLPPLGLPPLGLPPLGLPPLGLPPLGLPPLGLPPLGLPPLGLPPLGLPPLGLPPLGLPPLGLPPLGLPPLGLPPLGLPPLGLPPLGLPPLGLPPLGLPPLGLPPLGLPPLGLPPRGLPPLGLLARGPARWRCDAADADGWQAPRRPSDVARQQRVEQYVVAVGSRYDGNTVGGGGARGSERSDVHSLDGEVASRMAHDATRGWTATSYRRGVPPHSNSTKALATHARNARGNASLVETKENGSDGPHLLGRSRPP